VAGADVAGALGADGGQAVSLQRPNRETGLACMSRREIEDLLTAPGAPFEVVSEPVRGVLTKVYRHRLASLRAVAELAEGRGEQPFLVFGDRQIPYGPFVGSCRAWSAGLAGGPASVGHGDRVAVLAANCPEWCAAFWATVSMGSVLVGLNGWWTGQEVVHGLTNSGATVLLADRERYERVAKDLASCPDLRAVYLIDADPSEVAAAPEGVALLNVESLQPATAAGAGDVEDPWLVPIDEDDPAVIFYTSGTTGAAKGVVSTHRSMLANLQNTLLLGAIASATGAGLGAAQPTTLLTTPLFHVAGCHSCLVVALAAGTRLVVLRGRFDAGAVIELVERERVDIWAAVPTMIRQVLLHPSLGSHDLSSLRSIAFGGAPAGSDLRRRVAEAFPGVRSVGNAYGLTETSSVATYCSEDDAVGRPGSVGRPLPVVDTKVVDPETATEALRAAPALSGEIGEICIAGPILMAGYWAEPAATAQVMADGWFRTGDLGHTDADGYLFVDDRAKDVVIRGGENIYCAEVESRLSEHPLVAEAAVVGRPHAVLGEELEAVVVLLPDAEIEVDELRGWVGAALAPFKVPAHVQLRSDPLPRTASGKVRKAELRSPAVAEGPDDS
jgi:long-chain acyl-CoA synthetase